MSPPYKLVDMATGEDVPDFVGMDTAPGRFIEVYSGPAASNPDTRISGGALQRPGDNPDPPDPPDPTPPSGDSMDYPKTEQELRQCLMSYVDNNYVGILDPRTNVDIHDTIVIPTRSGSGSPWGVNGNYAKINFKGSGKDALRFEGVQGVNNRGLTVKNLVIDGGDGGNMSGSGAKACLNLSAPLGDNGPIYRFHIENVFLSGAVNGLMIEGGVYEGEVRGIYAENCTGDGIVLRHMMNPIPPGGKNPIVSNVLFWHVNSSRNYGAGMRTVYSIYLVGGSFILNGGGGVVAPEGIRGAIFSNGENTGGENQCVFDVPSNGYGSVIEIGEASSDGQTRCRKWTGSEWVDVGKPLLYYIAMGQGVTEKDNHVSYYGGGSNPMRVVK